MESGTPSPTTAIPARTRTVDGETVHSFATLLEHRSSVTWDEVRIPAHPVVPPFYLTTTPDPLQTELFRRVGLKVSPSLRLS